jgi:MoaA/NifB/PqqE/SkfB family radical SAM enzyme
MQHFWACIGPNAELYACGHRTYNEVPSYGNLLEKSFQEIWESNKRKKDLKKLPDDFCKICSPNCSKINTYLTNQENSKGISFNEDPELICLIMNPLI